MQTHSGQNSQICVNIRLIFLLAVRTVTFKSLLSLTISSVWVPMEPVEPKIAIFFIISFLPDKERESKQ